MTTLRDDIALAKVAIGILEWRLEEGGEQDGRFGVTRMRLREYLSEVEGIEVSKEDEEELEERLYNIMEAIEGAMKKTLKEFDQTGGNNAEQL